MKRIRKNNGGFTLVELLATITILGILLGIAIPSVIGYMNRGKQTYYHSLEDSVLNSARDYLIDYRSLYPREIGNMTTVSGTELIMNKYISDIDDEDGNQCEATVVVEKADKDEYDYHVCLKCGDNYSSSDESCGMITDSGTARNYVIEVDSFPTEILQGDDLTLPKARVYAIEDGVKTLITDQLEATPRTIDTTVLGTTNVRWVYRYKTTNPVSVRVVDKVAPEQPTVELSYADGTEYVAVNNNGNINATSKMLIMEITSRDYACVLGTTCRSRYPELEGSGVKELLYRGETDSTDRVIATSDVTTRYNENETLWGTVNLKAVDNSNNVSEETTFKVYLDNVVPSKTTVSYLGGSNTHSWKNNYKLKLSATDNVDVAYYEIYIDGSYYGTTGEEWTPPNNFSSCKVTFRAVDLAGNKGAFSDSHHIHMDTESPTKTSVNLNGYSSGSWTNKNVTQTYSATDNVGVAYYEYAHSTGATSATKISNPWVINWDGEWTFYVRAVDEAGNRGAWSNAYVVRRDTVRPTCSVGVTNNPARYADWYIATTNIGITASSDNSSGVRSTSVNRPTINQTTGANGDTVTGTVTDNAGNSNTCSIVVKVDLTTPTPSAKSNPISLGTQDYNFADNINPNFGPAGGNIVCNPGSSLKTGTYNVTCTAVSVNGRTNSITFQARHSYPATYVPRTCTDRVNCRQEMVCPCGQEWCGDTGDNCDGAGTCTPNTWCCSCSRVEQEVCDTVTRDCSYYTCPNGGSPNGSTCYY